MFTNRYELCNNISEKEYLPTQTFNIVLVGVTLLLKIHWDGMDAKIEIKNRMKTQEDEDQGKDRGLLIKIKLAAS